MTDETDEAAAWQAQALDGGWLHLERRALVRGEVKASAGPKVTVYLRVERSAEGALEVREAAMRSSGPIDASTWRDVPFAIAGLMATAPIGPSGVATVTADAWLSGEAFSLAEALAAHFEPVEGGLGVFIGPAAPASGKLAALKAPARNLSDEFLADLAAAYRELVAAKRNPAPAIADQTGAPVATVRRWVAVARKRGYLPAATKGRAG